MRPPIRLASLFVAMLMLAGCATLRTSDAASGPSDTARVVTMLTSGWRFHDGPLPEAAAQPGYDDSAWQRVDLPHTWNRVGEYAVERSDRSDKRQGEGWYRLRLDGSSLPERQRHYLQFDGVGDVADIWVNGRHVGHHAGAYSRFRFDITNVLNRSGENIIAVRADNSQPAPGEPTADVIPLSGDFFIYGGLYRPVSLVSVAAAHVDLLDFGGPGVYARTVSVGERGADIAVRTKLTGIDAARAPVLVTMLRGADGREVARDEAPARGDEVVRQLHVDDPHLWDGRRDPYLYSLIVELRDGGHVLDRVVQPYGIRTYRIDPDSGFFLNGRHIALHGVSRHQDDLMHGGALTHADHARDMAMIEEIGANTIRFAHYEHAQDWYDLADRAGMVVWSEAPFVNKPSFGNAAATPALIANARQQMTELIRQNYNHPSVMVWGIGNETDLDLVMGRMGPKADPVPLLDTLRGVARAEDPYRPTVIADCCEATPGRKPDYMPDIAGHADLMGYNRYYGWYYGKPAELGPHLDTLHAAHPDIPISVSEYGAGGGTSQHTDNPLGGPIDTGGRPHPEEYESWFHEQSWPQLEKRDYLWSSWVWNMFDFASLVRQEGDAVDINDKGLVTMDRKTRKDAFFYYKAQWSDAPVVHINGRRYVDRAYPVSDVRIYSNAPRVTLTLNGRDLGEAACADAICVFPNVRLVPGANHLAASALFDGRTVTDAIDWNAPDAADGLAINVGDLSGFEGPGTRRTGSDNWFDGGEPHRFSPEQRKARGGAGDARLKTGYREDAFAYRIPLPHGKWTVTMLFVEPDAKRDRPRRFDVSIEGRRVLTAFDPARAAGGALKGVARSFTADVRDHTLDLDFSRGAVLSGITVRPAVPVIAGDRAGRGRSPSP